MTSPAGADPLVGTLVGNYRILERLGRGGMGAVYSAEHPIIGKRVAIKVLHPDHASKQDLVSRFFAEGRAINEVDHPNIVDIIDFGTIPDDGSGRKTAYLVMELLHGRSMRSVLRDEAPLALDRTVDICTQIAAALDASHRKHVVHRDLKPDNIMLVERDGRPDYVKILDFGIAKLVGDQIETQHHTQTGTVMGTPKYMSPEQCEGNGDVDHRTDIYSLGILLYAMLTRCVPFTGAGYGQLVVQHLTVPPMPPSQLADGIPAHIEGACLRALEKHRDHRHQTMREFADALAGGADAPRAPSEGAGRRDGDRPSRVAGAPSLPEAPAGAGAPNLSPMSDPSDISQLESLPSAPGASESGASLPPVPEASPVPVPAAPAAEPRRSRRYVAWIASGAATLGVAGLVAALASGGGAPADAPGAATPPDPAPTDPAPTDAPPSAAPAPEIADAAPGGLVDAPAAEVEITVRSTPDAMLFVDGHEIGPTPQQVPAARGTEPIELRLEAPDHEPLIRQIVPDASIELDFELDESPRPRTPSRDRADTGAGARRPPSPDGEDDDAETLNPFEKYRDSPE